MTRKHLGFLNFGHWIHRPGTAPDARQALDDVVARLRERVGQGDWVVLSGSLPAGVDPALYARMVRELRPTGARIAVDTSDDPLRALGAALPGAAPDLIKPNGEELGQLTGVDGAELERRAADGDMAPVAAAARSDRHDWRALASALRSIMVHAEVGK